MGKACPSDGIPCSKYRNSPSYFAVLCVEGEKRSYYDKLKILIGRIRGDERDEEKE